MQHTLAALRTEEQFTLAIAALESQVIALRQARNRCVPMISRLPAEVLSNVFEQLAFTPSREDEDRGDDDELQVSNWIGGSPRNYHPCWAASQVCKFWRDVALTSPRLWGILYAHCSQQWLELLMERAKSAPLYFRAQARFGHSQQAATFVLARVDQFQEITLDAKTPQGEKDVHKVLTSLTPFLRHLDIRVSNPLLGRLEFAPCPPEAYEPRLQSLHLANCTFSFDSPRLSMLQNLRIAFDNNPRFDNLRYAAEDLLMVIDDIPMLYSLDLRLVLKENHGLSSARMVVLPHMRKLRLDTSSWTDLALLTHIQADQLNCVEIHPHPGVDTTLESKAALSYMTSLLMQYSHGSPPLFQLLHAQVCDPSQSDRWGMRSSPPTIKFRLQFEGQTSEDSVEKLRTVKLVFRLIDGAKALAALCQPEELQPPQVLSLAGQGRRYLAFVRRQLCEVHQVTRLQVNSLKDAVEALSLPNLNQFLDSVAFPLPALRSVRVLEFDQDEVHADSAVWRSLLKLKKLLMTRSEWALASDVVLPPVRFHPCELDRLLSEVSVDMMNDISDDDDDDDDDDQMDVSVDDD